MNIPLLVRTMYIRWNVRMHPHVRYMFTCNKYCVHIHVLYYAHGMKF